MKWEWVVDNADHIVGLLGEHLYLALFVVLPGILDTQILDPVNVVVALTVYTVALLVRTVVEGLRSVPDHVRQAATAVGYRRLGQLTAVELPIALPVVFGGIRSAALQVVATATVAAADRPSCRQQRLPAVRMDAGRPRVPRVVPQAGGRSRPRRGAGPQRQPLGVVR